MQMVQLTNMFLHVMAMKETKITAQDAGLRDLFLKLNFRVVNNAHFKLSWFGSLSAMLFFHTHYKGLLLDVSWGPVHFINKQQQSGYGVILLPFSWQLSSCLSKRARLPAAGALVGSCVDGGRRDHHGTACPEAEGNSGGTPLSSKI